MRFRKHYTLTLFLLAVALAGHAQSDRQTSSYLPLDPQVYNWIDRAVILSGPTAPHNLGLLRPYARQDIAALSDSLRLSRQDRRNTHLADFLQQDNSEFFPDSLTRRRKPILKVLFPREADLFAVCTPDFDLHISPAFSGQVGKDKYTDNNYLINTRGIEVRGSIDGRVSFYTFLADNQVYMPKYVGDYSTRLPATTLFPRFPQEAFVKPLGTKPNQYDFITARGHIAVQATKHIRVAFGQDRFFSGDGMRSLILGDQAPAFPGLMLDVGVWKLRYTNIFGLMKAGGRKPLDQYIPNKGFAYHQLDLDLLPNLKFSVFESVVFRSRDSTKRFYDLAYLNPIIFYRFVEQYGGSPDNPLVGASARWDFLRQFRLYGSLVFDELRFKELKAQNAWWGNKYAFQLGLKWVDPFGLPGLDLQGELNYIRPFTYTHRDKFTNYTHYSLPIAHPMGANLKEFIGRAGYQVLPRLRLEGTAFVLNTGLDQDTINRGQDVLRSYDDRVRLGNGQKLEYGYETGGGIASRIVFLQGNISYMPWHRVFVETGVTVRRQTIAGQADRNTLLYSVGLRWNFYRRDWLF